MKEHYVLYCDNQECFGSNVEYESGNFRLKYRSGKMVPEFIGSPILCPIRGMELKFREVPIDIIPKFGINDFAGLSDDQKKDILKKRYEKRMTASSKDEVETRKKNAIGKMIGYEK